MYDLRSATILFEEAQKLNLTPRWITDYGLFSIVIQDTTMYIFYSISFLNRHSTSYFAKNKHITRTILAVNNLPNIPFCLPQSQKEAWEFLKKYKTIIAKPTLGQHAQDVHLIKNANELKQIDISQYIMEQFIEGKEYRYLVLDHTILAVHHKSYPPPINDPKKVKRISLEKSQWDAEICDIAVRVTRVLNLRLAAVDFIVQKDGTYFILEVNAAPGIYHFHYPTKGPAINFSKILLEATIKDVIRETDK